MNNTFTLEVIETNVDSIKASGSGCSLCIPCGSVYGIPLATVSSCTDHAVTQIEEECPDLF